MLPPVPPAPGRPLQQMPRSAARFCLKVQAFLQKNGDEADSRGSFLVAVSGGADSIALLYALACLRIHTPFVLEAAHIDHALRPSSGQEASWVMDVCKSLGIVCHTERVDVAACAEKKGIGLEEAGRMCRYAYLEQVRKKRSIQWIALGHTANDLAEDILMRLLRGAGWPALGGMAAKDVRRRLLRPLLSTPRSQIEAFLAAAHMPHLTDPSNLSQTWLRNRIRHAFLPLFLQENPRFLAHMVALHEKAAWDQDYWNAVLPDAGPVIGRSTLRALPKAARMRLYKRQIEKIRCHPTLIALKALDKAVCSKKSGLHIQFQGNGYADIKKDAVVFGNSQGA